MITSRAPLNDGHEHDHEAYLPAPQHPPPAQARLSRPHEDTGRSESARQPPPQGPLAVDRGHLQEVAPLVAAQAAPLAPPGTFERRHLEGRVGSAISEEPPRSQAQRVFAHPGDGLTCHPAERDRAPCSSFGRWPAKAGDYGDTQIRQCRRAQPRQAALSRALSKGVRPSPERRRFRRDPQDLRREHPLAGAPS